MEKFWNVHVDVQGVRTYSINGPKLVQAAKDMGHMQYQQKAYLRVDVATKACRVVDISDIKQEMQGLITEPNAVDTDLLQQKIQKESVGLYNPGCFRDYLLKDTSTGLNDTKDKVSIPFNNGILVVDERGHVLEGFGKTSYWENTKMSRDFVVSAEWKDSYFYRFCLKLANDDDTRMRSLMSVIGFGISTYKDPSHCPAIILNDMADNINPKGRTGKGILVKVISTYRCRLYINGKTLDKLDKFCYQQYTPDVSLVHIDDVTPTFDFTAFFSEITEGFSYEEKGLKSVKVLYKDSPKYFLNTNTSVGGLGESNTDRMYEYEVAPFFSPTNRPGDFFGTLFAEPGMLDVWDPAEWSRCDAFVIECVKTYISEGLIPCPPTKNQALKKLRASTSNDFPDWADYNVRAGSNIYPKDIKELWSKEFPKSRVSGRALRQWIREFGTLRGWNLTHDPDDREREHIMFPDVRVPKYMLFAPDPDELLQVSFAKLLNNKKN